MWREPWGKGKRPNRRTSKMASEKCHNLSLSFSWELLALRRGRRPLDDVYSQGSSFSSSPRASLYFYFNFKYYKCVRRSHNATDRSFRMLIKRSYLVVGKFRLFCALLGNASTKHLLCVKTFVSRCASIRRT